MKSHLKKILMLLFFLLSSCSGFQTSKVVSALSEEKAIREGSDWLQRDTEKVIQRSMATIKEHQAFKEYLRNLGRTPIVFVGQVKNMTGEGHFPIQEINDELLTELSASGDFILVDSATREAILEKVTSQKDGKVNSSTLKLIGRQTGANLMIFGNVDMQPRGRDGETLKQYTMNLRMTDIERGIEVLRTQTEISK